MTALFASYFLLLAFSIKLKFAIASGVHDTDNNKVENGGDYFILPSFEEEGGGVTLGRIGARHPPAVVQSASKYTLGLPATISSPDGTMIILTDDMVSIKFINYLDCNCSTTWMLVLDESVNVWYIGIGSAEDYPSSQIKMGSFQIKEYDHDYKFVFCTDSNTSYCEDVGIYNDSDGNSRLALHGAAFPVKFKNADEDVVTDESVLSSVINGLRSSVKAVQ